MVTKLGVIFVSASLLLGCDGPASPPFAKTADTFPKEEQLGQTQPKPDETIKQEKASPDSGPQGPAPEISPEEREKLIRRTEIEDPKAVHSK